MAGERVLLIDDEPDAREVVGFRLESAGYKVLLASTGKEGMRLAERKRPDLVILDVVLPDVTGYGVCMYLRENEKTKDIPIVMLTGKRKDWKDKRLGEITGATYYLEKPYEPRDLLDKVNIALQVGKRGRESEGRGAL